MYFEVRNDGENKVHAGCLTAGDVTELEKTQDDIDESCQLAPPATVTDKSVSHLR